MLFFYALALLSITSTQSLASSIYSDARSNTCLRRSVFVYTQDSTSYVVTDIGSTSFAATPTVCANASVSTFTVYGSNQTVTRGLPASTITVYQQPTSTQESGSEVVADNGFENGNDSPFNTAASGPEVTAEISQSGPLQPYNGSNYLLITFNNSATTQYRVKRQAPVPLVYNVTQSFAASAGVSYSLTAYGTEGQNGDTAPDCALTICADYVCGASVPITAQYSPYSYQYNAAVGDPNAVATFSVQCAQSAYVALDNVVVSQTGAGALASSPATTTVYQYITRTQTQPVTQNITQIETTSLVGTPPTRIYSITNTVSTVSVATATEIVTQPETVYLNLTLSELSTTTTTITTTLRLTTTQNTPSLVYETATATTTALITYTNTALSILSFPPGTLTTIEETTLQITTTVPPITQTLPAATERYTSIVSLPQATEQITLPQATTIPPAQTEIYTSIVYSTDIEYSTVVQTSYATLPQATRDLNITLPQATTIPPPQTEIYTSVVYSTVLQTSYLTLPQATQSLNITLPQATYTPPPQTDFVTISLEPVTITVTITPPPVTQYETQTATAPTQTVQITETELPATQTLQITQTEIPPTQTLQITQTEIPPTQTLEITQTEIPPTQTLQITQTEIPPTQTLQITQTEIPPTQTLQVTQTEIPPTQTLQITQTEIPATQTLQITQTEIPPTQTLQITQTEIPPTQTLQITETEVPPTQTLQITQTLPPDTTVMTATLNQTFTLNQTYTLTETYTPPPSPSSDDSAPLTGDEPTSAPPPAVALASPTAIVGDAISGSEESYDDSVFQVTLPFPLTLYHQSSSTVQVSTNGVLGLTTLDYEYSNVPLPYFNSDYGDNFLDTGVLGLWSDLYIFQGSKEGIYYEVDGTAPYRKTTFEFYLSWIADANQYYHFLMIFLENQPNIVTVQYLNVSDNGVHATVGVESASAGDLFLQYSFNEGIIYPGLQLTYDTSVGNGNIEVTSPSAPL